MFSKFRDVCLKIIVFENKTSCESIVYFLENHITLHIYAILTSIQQTTNKVKKKV